MKYCSYDCKSTKNLALTTSKGVYQTSLLHGLQTWSGADLKGKAKSYSRFYKRSRENLINRLELHGLIVEKKIGPHNKITMKISSL